MSFVDLVIKFLEMYDAEKNVYRHIKINICKMSESMKTEAVDVIQRGFELYNSISRTAEYIRDKFNSKYGASDWNCIICKCQPFRFNIRSMPDRFIYLSFHEYEVILWGIAN